MRRRQIPTLLVLACFVFFFAEAAVTQAPAQRFSLGLRMSPLLTLPLGESVDLFESGFGGQAVAVLGLPGLSWLSPELDLGYTTSAVKAESGEAGLGIGRAGVGALATLPLGRHFGVQAEAAGGYFGGKLSGDASGTGGGFYGQAGAAFTLFIDRRFGASLGANYLYYRDLYSGLSVGVGLAMRVRGPGGGALPSETTPALFKPASAPSGGLIRLEGLELERVFPVLFKYYDTHPVGRLTVTNVSKQTLADVEVRLAMEQYIDNPKLSGRIERLTPGQSQVVELYALFNEKVLTVTEGIKVAAKVSVAYKVEGRVVSDAETITLEMYDRNALRWDDDRKVAAFVTAKDDEVQRFAKNTASLTRESGRDALSRNLQLAMAMLAALKEQGLSYVVDPKSSYAELSANEAAVDYVQFPRQTLQFKAGDCDDLSATYCALLEAVGVATAFITVPGHIYAAVQLEMDEKSARGAFSAPGDLIFAKDGTVWLPVETTLLKDGFLRAWSEGAREWREHAPKGRAAFYPVAEAWATYQPVAFGAGSFQVGFPPEAKLRAAFLAEMNRLTAREVGAKERGLLDALRKQDDPATRNKLGVLYARYGFEDKAREQFSAILAKRATAYALVNMGNLDFVKGNNEKAADYYERAVAADPKSAAALIALARTRYAQEKYAAARELYDRAATLDRPLAERYAYLAAQGAGTERASDTARLSGTVIWETE